MDSNTETIRELRSKVSGAMLEFRTEMDFLVDLKHDGEISLGVYHHDNVRIVTGLEAPYKLDKSKYQVVVIMSGEWRLKHGQAVRDMIPGDTAKVPHGSPIGTTMETDDPNAKLVYVQFESYDQG